MTDPTKQLHIHYGTMNGAQGDAVPMTAFVDMPEGIVAGVAADTLKTNFADLMRHDLFLKKTTLWQKIQSALVNLLVPSVVGAAAGWMYITPGIKLAKNSTPWAIIYVTGGVGSNASLAAGFYQKVFGDIIDIVNPPKALAKMLYQEQSRLASLAGNGTVFLVSAGSAIPLALVPYSEDKNAAEAITTFVVNTIMHLYAFKLATEDNKVLAVRNASARLFCGSSKALQELNIEKKAAADAIRAGMRGKIKLLAQQVKDDEQTSGTNLASLTDAYLNNETSSNYDDNQLFQMLHELAALGSDDMPAETAEPGRAYKASHWGATKFGMMLGITCLGGYLFSCIAVLSGMVKGEENPSPTTIKPEDVAPAAWAIGIVSNLLFYYLYGRVSHSVSEKIWNLSEGTVGFLKNGYKAVRSGNARAELGKLIGKQKAAAPLALQSYPVLGAGSLAVLLVMGAYSYPTIQYLNETYIPNFISQAITTVMDWPTKVGSFLVNGSEMPGLLSKLLLAAAYQSVGTPKGAASKVDAHFNQLVDHMGRLPNDAFFDLMIALDGHYQAQNGASAGDIVSMMTDGKYTIDQVKALRAGNSAQAAAAGENTPLVVVTL